MQPPGWAAFLENEATQTGSRAVVCGGKPADASAEDRNVKVELTTMARLRCRALVCPRYVMMKPPGDAILAGT
jgi:hypothetical protein